MNICPTRLRRHLWPVAAAAAGLLAVPAVVEAVLVAPHALFIDHRTRSGEVYLVNQGTEPEEVTVELRYGYPASDSAGGVYITWPTAGEGERSAAEWLRAFPRRLRVEPGQRQLVRVLATPPADLADGEYWSRLIVTSRTVAPPVAVTADSAVQAGLTLELRTITSITYRKGVLQTGVRLTDFRTRQEGDSLVAWVGLARDGNAAFLGSVRFEVRDANNRQVAEWSTPIAVYVDVMRRFAVPVDTLPRGTYRVRLLVSTAREDIPADQLLPVTPIERTVGIDLR